MLRLLVLLLSLPTLLTPSGLCACRLASEVELAWQIFAPAAPSLRSEQATTTAGHCPKGCCRDAGRSGEKQRGEKPDAAKKNAPTAPLPEAPCCVTAHSTADTKVSEHLGQWVHTFLAFVAVQFVSFDPLPARVSKPHQFDTDSPAVSPPAYISFCTLLI